MFPGKLIAITLVVESAEPDQVELWINYGKSAPMYVLVAGS